jgi:Tol biopolymer transport system component/imidazolonepropionase-like amidohydrolase
VIWKRRLGRVGVFVLGFLLPGAPASIGAPARKEAKKDAAADINTPRSDARRVSFEAREGTWMCIDVSPDGKALVFDLLGDIYALPIAGGNARSLTRGPAYDYHPRFSPDGKTIAFTSDRGGMENLWLIDADGKNPRALTSEKDAYVRSAAWTPDGIYLVARKEESKRAGIPPVELWMYHRNGGGGIKLTSADDVNNASGPVASRDGRFIYFSARKARFSYIPNLSQGLWQIMRFDRVTGETFPLTSGFGGAVRPALSPDGKTMVFASRRDNDTVLVARDLDTGAERPLVRGVTRDEQEGFAQMDLWPNYAFTPDGSSVVFSNHGKIARLDFASRKLTEIPFTVHIEQWLAPRVAWQEKVPSGPVAARILRWPGQSADGKSIVFDAFGRVWLQELEAGKVKGPPRRLTTDAPGLAPREYAPALSPDGRWVAYVTWSDAEGGAVWKMPLVADAAASAPVRLTRRPGHYANPAWSPRSDRLVVIRGSGLELRGQQPEEEEFFEIHWLDAAGGETHYITSVKLAETLKFHPQAFWNSDGTRVYFRDPIKPEKPTDPPKNLLVSVRLDGTDKKKHLQFPAVGDVVPSPDGQWVAFTSRDNVFVTALPPIQTAKPPEVDLKEGAVPVWRLSDEAGGYVGWTEGGKTITWGLANVFHRLPVSTAIAFVEQEKRKAEAKKKKEQPKAKKASGGENDSENEEELRVPRSETVEIRLTTPRPVPDGSVVLKGARVITMKGEEVIDGADVVVTGNRIAAVGPSGRVAVPAGARTFDASGKTIIPGIIDTHAHLHYSGFELFPETKWEYAASLAYGVTTVYDPSAPSLDVFAQAEMVEAGLMLGPRVYSSGDVLYGGQQADIFAEVNDQDDARRQVRRMKAYGARMIKVYQQPRREQRIWFAEACRELRMLLTAEGAGEMHTDLTMAIDGYTAFEHALPVEPREDYVQLLAKSKTHYTPTLLVAYGGPWGELYYWQTANPHDDPKLNRFVPHRTLDPLARRHPWITLEEYHFPTVARGVAKVLNAGGNVSLGAHGQLQGLGVHWELWAMAGEGAIGKPVALTAMQALRASTILAADKIGFASDLGSIEPGKLADLIVLEGNPLKDIKATAQAKWVMKNGELYDAASLKQEWPHERALPAFFWRATEDATEAGSN